MEITFELEDWVESGFSRHDAYKWKARSFELSEAIEWKKHDFNIIEAQYYRLEGYKPEEAAKLISSD